MKIKIFKHILKFVFIFAKDKVWIYWRKLNVKKPNPLNCD